MENRVNYTLVGLFVIGLSALLIFGAIFLSKDHPGRFYQTFFVKLKTGVSGLNEEAPVKFNGVNVGTVDEIHLDPTDDQVVILTLKIDKSVRITTKTQASLKPQGITGIVYLALSAIQPNGPLLKPKPGEKYATIPSDPNQLVQLTDNFRSVGENVNEISRKITLILDEENVTALKSTLKHLAQITKTLDENKEQIIKTLSSLDGSASAVKNFADKGQTSLRILSEQTLPQIMQVLDGWDEITTHLKGVSQDLEDNPSVLIRGKKDKK